MATFIFIDESGDPGDIAPDESNSKHYAELALQVNDKEFKHFLEHVTNWRYFKGFFRESKELPSGKDLKRFLDPIIVLHEEGLIQCSCVYLDKRGYTGPYLKDRPLWFRNFVHRKLLEFHFSNYPVKTNDLEIVFDRFDLSKDELDNLDAYFKNNRNLPTFKHITHIDSTYCEALQLAGQLVNTAKDLKLGGTNLELKELLKFLPIKDITQV